MQELIDKFWSDFAKLEVTHTTADVVDFLYNIRISAKLKLEKIDDNLVV